MKKIYIVSICLALLMSILAFSGCGFQDEEAEGDSVVYEYNWGDYIDPDTLEQFE